LTLLKREHHIWRTVSDPLALRYVCWERLDGGGWAVQQCDWVRADHLSTANDWPSLEKYRVEGAVECQPSVWLPSVELAIESFDAVFENDWTAPNQ
jgi:hypothetical protein